MANEIVSNLMYLVCWLNIFVVLDASDAMAVLDGIAASSVGRLF